MKKKTIYDLASELNIAPSTISKALNNKKGVNLETRNRIVEYAKENGYVANPTARALKSKHNYTIGILYSELSNAITKSESLLSPTPIDLTTYLKASFKYSLSLL